LSCSAKISLVSVLVQTYHQEAYIKQCLNGILMQQGDFRMEVLLGVDSSEDATEAICRDYAAKYPNIIRLFVRDPADKVILFGQPIGRFNFCQNLLAAGGDYVAVVEGDDYWTDPKKLQKQLDFLQKGPLRVLTCTHRKVLRDGELNIDPAIDKIVKSNGGRPFQITTENFFRNYCVSTCTCFFRREALDLSLVKGNPTSFKDIFLFWALLLEGEAYLLPDVTTVYRIHEGGTWSMQSNFRRSRANGWTSLAMNRSWLGKHPAVQKRAHEDTKSYLTKALKAGSFLDVSRAFCWVFKNLIVTFKRKISK
jgi:glycosyltransferase involved in cell wall biosynthesis